MEEMVGDIAVLFAEPRLSVQLDAIALVKSNRCASHRASRPGSICSRILRQLLETSTTSQTDRHGWVRYLPSSPSGNFCPSAPLTRQFLPAPQGRHGRPGHGRTDCSVVRMSSGTDATLPPHTSSRGSGTRAATSTSTAVAPAASSAFAQVLAVAPEVITSSISSTVRPVMHARRDRAHRECALDLHYPLLRRLVVKRCRHARADQRIRQHDAPRLPPQRPSQDGGLIIFPLDTSVADAAAPAPGPPPGPAVRPRRASSWTPEPVPVPAGRRA